MYRLERQRANVHTLSHDWPAQMMFAACVFILRHVFRANQKQLMMTLSSELQVCGTLNLPGFAQLMSSDHTPREDEEVAQQQHQ